MGSRFLLIALLAFPALGASRYVTDREGAPIAWQAWSPAALQRAQKANRPIFLSVCSASSYDCYRMHREAFLVGENADTMNEQFVPLLLDPIEYPEVAESYQTLLRSMTGRSGVPANFILIPTLEPVFAAGTLRADELSRALIIHANRWATERAALQAEARNHVEKARELGEKRAVLTVDDKSVEAVVDDIASRYDKTHGGFDAVTPRRPHPMIVSFLLRYGARTKIEGVRSVAVDTLKRMAVLPVRDQLGGGFHRGTTDLAWRQPLFEKLLTDQALLAMTYVEAAQITGDPELQFVARTTLDYVLRDLRNARFGTFDSSQDAYNLVPGQGPESVNGDFYLWTLDEIVRLVGREAAGKLSRVYGITGTGKTLPHLQEARFFAEANDELAAPAAKMLEVRQKRPEPSREFTAVAGWNGLMISAFARAGTAFDDERFREAAHSAMLTLIAKLWDPQKRTLYRTDAATTRQIEALSEDYAFVVQALLDVFQSTYDPKFFDLAVTLQQRQDELFWDASLGRYVTGSSVPSSLRGLLQETDQDVPSVNAVSATNLLRLASLTGRAGWATRPASIFHSLGSRFRTRGGDVAHLASAWELSQMTQQIVVVTGPFSLPETQAALRAVHARWEPMRTLIYLPVKGAARERVTRAFPFLAALTSDPEAVITYVCANGECRKP